MIGFFCQEMGFNGVIVIDVFNMKVIVDYFGQEEVVVMVIKVGVDIVLMFVLVIFLKEEQKYVCVI